MDFSVFKIWNTMADNTFWTMICYDYMYMNHTHILMYNRQKTHSIAILIESDKTTSIYNVSTRVLSKK